MCFTHADVAPAAAAETEEESGTAPAELNAHG